MSEKTPSVVWVVVTTHTQQQKLGLVQVFATEADARRMAADFNKARGNHKPSQFARVFRCEVK